MRKLTFVLIAIAAMAFLAYGQGTPPPHSPYQGGWGMNPTAWQDSCGGWGFWGIYDPNYQGDPGNGWVVGYDGSYNPQYVQYAPIMLHLYIELYAQMYYESVCYTWHRLGNQQECIEFLIQGTVKSNNSLLVGLAYSCWDLGYLHFMHDIFGNPTAGSDIPIEWKGRWGNGLVYGSGIVQGWTVMVPDPDLLLEIYEPCDHWFQFKGKFCLPYHIDDGYYYLIMYGVCIPGVI